MPGDWLVRFDESSLRGKPLQLQGPIPAFYSIPQRLRGVLRGSSDAPRRPIGRPSSEIGRRGHTWLLPGGHERSRCESTRGGPGVTPRQRQPVQPRPAWGVCVAATRAPGVVNRHRRSGEIPFRRKAQPHCGPKGLAGQACWRWSRTAKNQVLMGTGELLVSAPGNRRRCRREPRTPGRAAARHLVRA